ncbi:MAG: hypothetical protein EOP67_62275, partial [Sphingomonas sp.]
MPGSLRTSPAKRWLLVGAVTLSAALVLTLALRFIAMVVVVRTSAMLPTLWPGDRIMVTHARGSLERGSIVVLRDSAGAPRLARVIGVPGERWGLVLGRPQQNGKPLLRWRIADLLLPPAPNLRCPIRRDAEDC